MNVDVSSHLTISLEEDKVKYVVNAPKTYGLVGKYAVDIIIMEPYFEGLEFLIYTIKDPCDSATAVFTMTMPPALSSYKVAAEAASYTFTFSDNVSEYFAVENTCG
jgi:hypothetical protein